MYKLLNPLDVSELQPLRAFNPQTQAHSGTLLSAKGEMLSEKWQINLEVKSRLDL